MRTRSLAAIVLSVLAACSSNDSDHDLRGPNGVAESTSGPEGPWSLPATPPVSMDSAPLRIDTLARGLEVPWALAVAPDGRLFLTERPGRIRVLVNDTLQPRPWFELDVYAHDPDYLPETGLMGIALAPDFASTGQLYVAATFRAAPIGRAGPLERIRRRFGATATPTREWEGRVYRITDRDGRGADAELIISGLPADHYHVGGALAFGPDGMLYVTTGEALDHRASLDPLSLAGKVLRYRPDGGVPHDNPTVGSPVYAYGFRNPQGLGWLGDGAMLLIDHGPSGTTATGSRLGGDRLHLVGAGGNHGWPPELATREDARSPVAEWTPAIAPAGLAIGSGAPGLAHVYVGELQGRRVRQLVLERSDQAQMPRVVAQRELPLGLTGRIRLTTIGPDGCLHVGTSNRDGRGSPHSEDDLLIRVCRLAGSW